MTAAVAAAERLRALVEAQPFDIGDERLVVTVSIGLAQWRAGGLSELMRAADTQLYRAKREGRNRVCTEALP